MWPRGAGISNTKEHIEDLEHRLKQAKLELIFEQAAEKAARIAKLDGLDRIDIERVRDSYGGLGDDPMMQAAIVALLETAIVQFDWQEARIALEEKNDG